MLRECEAAFTHAAPTSLPGAARRQSLRSAEYFYGTHKHARVKAWLARRPRFHLHFTPTYRWWLNQVERWFALITTQATGRGSFDSVADLKREIDAFVKHHIRTRSRSCGPPWPNRSSPREAIYSALPKIERLCKFMNGT